MTAERGGMNRIQRKGRKPKPHKDAEKARNLHYIDGLLPKVVAGQFPKVNTRTVYKWLNMSK